MRDLLKLIDKILVKLIKKLRLKDTVTLIGDGYAELRRKDGSVIEGSQEVVKQKMIMNVGKELVAKLLGDVGSPNHLGYIAIGIGVTAEDPAQTGLISEVKREACSPVPSYLAPYKCVFERTFTFGSAESYAIIEASVEDSSGSTGSIILDRFKLASVKNVDVDTDIYIKITITVA